MLDVDMQEAYRMSLMILFVQKLNGLMMNREIVFSFVVRQEGGDMHGAKWMSVGNDITVEMIL